MTTANDFCAATHGFLDPGDNAVGRFFTDQWAYIRGFVEYVADLKLLNLRNQSGEKFVKGALFHKNSLHGNARLAGIAKAADYAAVGGVFQVGVRADHHTSIAAQ